MPRLPNLGRTVAASMTGSENAEQQARADGMNISCPRELQWAAAQPERYATSSISGRT
jgi:hypothetical protein